MSRTIWKFAFDVADEIYISMPGDASFLHVAEQHGQPCMWCEVDPDKSPSLVGFRLRGTGHPFDGTEDQYVGSFFMMGGALVFHLYTEKSIKEADNGNESRA